MKPKARKKSEKITDIINLEDDTTCSECLAEFVDPDDLKQHTALVHRKSNSAKHKCYFCYTICSDLIDFSTHLRDKHLCELKFCKLCTRAFESPSEYEDHKKLHKSTLPSKYKCSQCNIIFRNFILLREHEIHEHSWPESGIILEHLSPYIQSVINNDLNILYKPPDSYACRKCSHKCTNLGAYIKHLKKSKCKVFTCDRCCKNTSSKSKMSTHLRKCSGKPLVEKQFVKVIKTTKCKTCLKNIVDKNYKQHFKNCNRFTCKHCNAVLNNLNEYTKHQTLLHPVSITMLTCRYCNQMLSHDSFYKHVKKSHGSTYKTFKYNCTYCNKIFNHPQKLFAHFNGQHKDIEPYTCTICDKKFRIRTKFTIHIKMVHKSEGHVEFDKNFSVFFVKTKSGNPFVPKENPTLFTADELADKTCSDNDETDLNTDIEGGKKIKHKTTLETELETEDEKTFSKPKVIVKRARRNINILSGSETESDDEPLIKKRKTLKKSKVKISKNRLICNICNKKCYTMDNFNRHMTFHFKKESKQCIKCGKLFKTVQDLEGHMSKEHSSSQLTKTLQELLAKRKIPNKIMLEPQDFNIHCTMRRVISTPCNTSAKIILVDPNDSKSAKKYLESFLPENKQNLDAEITSSATIKLSNKAYTHKAFKPNIVKYNKTEYNIHSKKLRMPVKYRAFYKDKTKAIIKLVQVLTNNSTTLSNEDGYEEQYTNYFYEDQKDDDEDAEAIIPDVAEEVFLENTNLHTQQVEHNYTRDSTTYHKLIIPNVPKEMNKLNQFHIGHLQPQAPYIKITPIKKLLDKKPKPKECIIPDSIQLASGTKLVRANPLAHLLGDKMNCLQAKPKYYKPKISNVTSALAQALMKLKDSQPKKKKKAT